MHLWLLYLVKELQISFVALKKDIDQYTKYVKILKNLDTFFPKVITVNKFHISDDNTVNNVNDNNTATAATTLANNNNINSNQNEIEIKQE